MTEYRNIGGVALEKFSQARKNQERRCIFWEYKHQTRDFMSNVPEEIDQAQLQEILKNMYRKSMNIPGDPDSPKKPRPARTKRKPQ